MVVVVCTSVKSTFYSVCSCFYILYVPKWHLHSVGNYEEVKLANIGNLVARGNITFLTELVSCNCFWKNQQNWLSWKMTSLRTRNNYCNELLPQCNLRGAWITCQIRKQLMHSEVLLNFPKSEAIWQMFDGCRNVKTKLNFLRAPHLIN